MSEYESDQELLVHLKVQNLPRKHWTESLGWKIREHMHLIVLKAFKATVTKASFLSVVVDEVTLVYN